MRSIVTLIAISLALAVVVTGCSDKDSSKTLEELQAAKAECAPPPVEIFLQAAKNLNLNDEGQPTPVELRVLQLKDREMFDQLDFETIWQRGEEALGKSLVQSASLTVFPGKLKIHPLQSAPEVAYIALVGVFRRPEGRSWAYVVDVSAQNRTCAQKDSLHTVLHAVLQENRIRRPKGQ